MKTKPLTREQYTALCTDLIAKGWIPVGEWGSRVFRKGGRNYDLSAADLTQLDRIEAEGLFLANPT